MPPRSTHKTAESNSSVTDETQVQTILSALKGLQAKEAQ